MVYLITLIPKYQKKMLSLNTSVFGCENTLTPGSHSCGEKTLQNSQNIFTFLLRQCHHEFKLQYSTSHTQCNEFSVSDTTVNCRTVVPSNPTSQRMPRAVLRNMFPDSNLFLPLMLHAHEVELMW